MTVRIRTFLNTDTPELTRLWNEHHELAGIHSQFSESAWEYSILGKLIFDAEGLFIAENDSGLVGFAHPVKLEGHDDPPNSDSNGLINALCVSEHANRDAIALQLINVAESYLAKANVKKIIATGSPDFFAFYLGVGDINGMLGVSSRDIRLRSWLEQSGYVASDLIDSWQLDLPSFRMPMDRTQIAIRRQGRIEPIADPTSGLDWWSSVIMGHSELFAFKLIMRDSKTFDRQVSFWQPEFAALNATSGQMHLMMPQITDQMAFDHYAFLIAEALRHFQQSRVARVRTTIHSNDILGTKLLERMNFRKDLHGTLFEKLIA